MEEEVIYLYFIEKMLQKDIAEKLNTSDIQILKKMHEQASLELSGGKKTISNRAFRDWNTSAYKYNNKNKCYELKKGINTGADAPKRIKWTAF